MNIAINNIYWHCLNGYRIFEDKNDLTKYYFGAGHDELPFNSEYDTAFTFKISKDARCWSELRLEWVK